MNRDTLKVIQFLITETAYLAGTFWLLEISASCLRQSETNAAEGGG